jgi:hypothetical protein
MMIPRQGGAVRRWVPGCLEVPFEEEGIWAACRHREDAKVRKAPLPFIVTLGCDAAFFCGGM